MAGKTKTEKTFNQRGCTLKKKKKQEVKLMNQAPQEVQHCCHKWNFYNKAKGNGVPFGMVS